MCKNLRLILYCGCILLVSFALIYTIVTWMAQKEISELEESFKGLGRPIRLEEMLPSMDVSPEHNAAISYEAADRLSKALSLNVDNIPSVEMIIQMMKSQDHDTVDSHLEQWRSSEGQEVIELIRDGAKRSHCFHDLDYAKGPNLDLAHLGYMSDWCSLMLMEYRKTPMP